MQVNWDVKTKKALGAIFNSETVDLITNPKTHLYCLLELLEAFYVSSCYNLWSRYISRKIKITVSRVIFILSPIVNVKNPKSTCVGENPTLRALKKKLFTGPFGKMLFKTNDNVEPMMPPMIIPKTIFPNFLFAIVLLL
jgi:hypothetical protein